MAPGHCLDLFFLIISVDFIVRAKNTVKAVEKFQIFAHSPRGIYSVSNPPHPESLTASKIYSANCCDAKSELLSQSIMSPSESKGQ